MMLSHRALIVVAAFSFALASFAAEPVTIKWTVENLDREALVFPPAVKDGSTKVAAVFVFHGHGAIADEAARLMRIQTDWPEALVVYMQGIPSPGMLGDLKGRLSGWQQTPGQSGDRDLKFFDVALANLKEKYAVDEQRIFATGMSNGGFFTYLLWAQRPKVFAALAPGACTILPTVQISEPRPVLHFAGKNDMLVLFKEQQATLEQLRNLNGCSDQGEPCGAGCTRYASAKGTPVEAFSHPAGHVYPPAATELIVKFFKEQTGNR